MADNKNKKAQNKPVSNKQNTQKTAKKSPGFLGLNEGFGSLFTLVGGLLLAVFYYFPDGFFGSVIRDFSLGLFGLPIYLLPVLLIVNGIHKSSKNL